MENSSDVLMLSGVTAHCADCGQECIFVPVTDDCAAEGCEFCCTACDAAVFLFEVLGNTPPGASGSTSGALRASA